MMKSRVLLVCDDPETGQIWMYALGQRNLEVVLTGSAGEAATRWENEVFDLIVIDVQTCQIDGIDLCRRLRAEGIIPILLLIPTRDESHVLEAYRAGVDECIVKPISPPVFLAKVRAWLRRSWTVAAEVLDCLQAGDLLLDSAQRQLVKASGCAIRLTNLEFRLLHVLMSHQNRMLDTETLVNRVWGYNGCGDSVVLKNMIYGLRRKIEPDRPGWQIVNQEAVEQFGTSMIRQTIERPVDGWLHRQTFFFKNDHFYRLEFITTLNNATQGEQIYEDIIATLSFDIWPGAIDSIRPDNATHLTELAQLGKGSIYDFTWLPDTLPGTGDRLLVGTSQGLYGYRADTLSETQFIPSGSPATVITVSRDGSSVAAAQENFIQLWSLADGAPRQNLSEHSDAVLRLTLSPNRYGRWLASGSKDGTLRLWDNAAGQTRHVSPFTPGGRFVFSADGRWLAVGGGKWNRRVQVYDLTTGQSAAELEISPI